MAEFFAELKHRHIYRVGAAYVVAAWALTQLVEILAQVFALPLWIAQTAIVLLAIGFPIALIVAWTIESKPHEAVAAAVRSKPTIVDWTLCGAMGVVVLLIGYQQLAPRSGVTAPAGGVDAARSTSLDPAIAISLAVLPFANLSSDPEQQFFSDGITEEITAAIAKITDLRVVARTSAFQFKGQNQDVQAIGQALRATHLIEGSVRKAGTRVRITAQLIKSDDGTHVWAETYDRELTDVFAIQEEIAQAIAGAMRVPLGLQQGERLVSNRTTNLETYDQYLRARTLFRAREISNAVNILDDVVAHDPDFAPAWGLLAASYLLLPNYTANTGEAGSLTALSALFENVATKAEYAASEAIRRDPRNPTGYWAMGEVEFGRGNWIKSNELFRQALTLDPNDPDALLRPVLRLAQSGHFKEALGFAQKLQALEPFVPVYNIFGNWVVALNGQRRAAIAQLEQLPARAAPYFRNGILAALYANEGQYEEAANTLLTLPADQSIVSRRMVEDAARILRTAPRSVDGSTPLPKLGALSWVYLHVGAPDAYFEFLEESVEARWYNITFVPPWIAKPSDVRRSERFKVVMRRAGLVDYWRVKGWPDLCRPVGADDFECS